MAGTRGSFKLHIAPHTHAHAHSRTITGCPERATCASHDRLPMQTGGSEEGGQVRSGSLEEQQGIVLFVLKAR